MTYEENYLAHYGVKGQRWGIRRYQNEDGTLTQLGKEHYSAGSGGNKKFDKQFRKEVKKFNKLADRADIDTQQKAMETHEARAKRAAKIGAVAGLTAASIAGLDRAAVRYNNNKSFHNFHRSLSLDSAAKTIRELAPYESDAAENFGINNFVRTEDRYKEAEGLEKLAETIRREDSDRSNFRNNVVVPIASAAFIAAGAAATTSLGLAAYNKIAATVNKKRLSDIGHAKAVAKRDAQYKKITNMVKDTPYAALFADQIAAYKKEHPNTELSDKQIMKNLM